MDDKNMKICQFGQQIHVIESEVWKSMEIFPFLHDIVLRQNYVVIFGKSLSEFYWIVLMCFYILSTLLFKRASSIKF